MTQTLPREVWTARAAAHTERIEGLIGPYLEARRRGEKHPVIDFLFTYYATRPTQLLRWHPGFGAVLDGVVAGDDYAGLQAYRPAGVGAVTVSEDVLQRHRDLLQVIDALLTATASRPARFGCFGLHEWAMVYRTDDTRHPVPLRLGPEGTDAVVESMPLRCTHYDAFRFFTPQARPLNATTLSRDVQAEHEQPGCLHATMDLYRFCLRLGPLVAGELLADAFALALDARTLDMCASPYDLTSFGYPPVRVETPDGRSEYLRRQTALAQRGTALRSRVLTACRTLLEAAGPARNPAGTP
ncbi:MAG: 3-methyladenine DNA glycosylase [Gordonia sp. (in: high G+C Gram-positive bacteria)]|uniref:3-methyladenine DNA glycosylase n=1 Tax=Gordonia sp. (in: high G+C Gram-positive bacteria) TaxID=84139 RepID=UPI0039E280A5